MINKGCPMAVLQELLGHEQYSSTTEIYARVSEKSKRDAYEKYLYQ